MKWYVLYNEHLASYVMKLTWTWATKKFTTRYTDDIMMARIFKQRNGAYKKCKDLNNQGENLQVVSVKLVREVSE